MMTTSEAMLHEATEARSQNRLATMNNLIAEARRLGFSWAQSGLHAFIEMDRLEAQTERRA